MSDPGLNDAVQPGSDAAMSDLKTITRVIAEHRISGPFTAAVPWCECSCGLLIGGLRHAAAARRTGAHVAAEVLAALDLPAREEATSDRWRALVNGVAIGARAEGNFDRERAALDILALDERMP